MTTNEKALIALSDLIGRMICSDGSSPTWDMIDEQDRLRKLVGKRWDWVNRCWREIVKPVD